MRRVATLIVAAALLVPVASPAIVTANSSPCQQGTARAFNSIAAMQFAAGYWSDGSHAVAFHYVAPSYGVDDTFQFSFQVDPAAPLYSGYAQIRFWGIRTADGSVVDTINPAQPTEMVAGWAWWPGDYTSMADIKAALSASTITFAWDGGDPALIRMGPVTNACVALVPGAYVRHYQ